MEMNAEHFSNSFKPTGERLITTDELSRLGYTDASRWSYVIFDNGDVRMPVGFGHSEAGARRNAKRAARKARVPPESLDGECYRIVLSMPW
jgi:hypothetical protein